MSCHVRLQKYTLHFQRYRSTIQVMSAFQSAPVIFLICIKLLIATHLMQKLLCYYNIARTVTVLVTTLVRN